MGGGHSPAPRPLSNDDTVDCKEKSHPSRMSGPRGLGRSSKADSLIADTLVKRYLDIKANECV